MLVSFPLEDAIALFQCFIVYCFLCRLVVEIFHSGVLFLSSAYTVVVGCRVQGILVLLFSVFTKLLPSGLSVDGRSVSKYSTLLLVLSISPVLTVFTLCILEHLY